MIEAGTRVRNKIPIVVMKGTGRASDLIGTATALLEEGKYGDLDSQTLVLTLDELLEQSFTIDSNNRTTYEYYIV